MILDSSYNTYLSVIQDESLSKIYEILPSLKSTHDYGSWDGWKEIKLTPSRTMGLFVSIENYDSPILINNLGSLDIPDATNAERSTKAWLLVEVPA